jgi:hypothetical protein
MKQFIVPVKITATRVADMLCGAFEGGSRGWARYDTSKSIKPNRIDFDQFKDEREFCGYDTGHVYPYVHWVMSPGGYLHVHDCEDYNTHWMLGLPEVEKGLVLMAEKAPQHFGDLISGNDDADTHDIAVQLMCMGEIVYG